ncbi:MAG: cysteine--tRNA ligase, partial [Clostridia bacterium]|nr:cysteine--tRNA ligase [Clostridia bacterium]
YDKIAERYIKEYFTDAEGLGIKRANHHPLATENIDGIINMVKTLIDKGFAYELDGDVYYSTKAFETYGKHSHQPLEELEAGARINVNEHKHDAMDFALWKNAKPGEPSWESPWGNGRPGWHIECSVMAKRYLGDTIDIHSGGVDLCFPHHENEIAQSEAANGKPFANYWMHNAFLNIDNKKMSKSLNNFFTVRDIADQVGYEPIRFFMLSAHYRSPINYTREAIEQAQNALSRINTAITNIKFLGANGKDGDLRDVEKESIAKFDQFAKSFSDAMDDDLNTADAIAAIFDLIREVNTICGDTEVTKAYAKEAKTAMFTLCDVLGIGNTAEEEMLDSEIEELINKRTEARKNKDYKESDRIRDLLKEKGIILYDTPQGVKWSREN